MNLHDDSPERTPLLNNANGHHDDDDREGYTTENTKARVIVWSVFTLLFAATLIILVGFEDKLADGIKAWLGILPNDPVKAASVILDKAPIIVSDLCVDLK